MTRRWLWLFAWALACGSSDARDGAVPASGSTTEDGAEGFTSSSSTGATQGSSGRADDGSSESDETGPMPPPEEGPARYPAGEVHSPITPHVAQRLQAIATHGPGREDVFLKAGGSSTVAPQTLFCFAAGSLDLGAHGELEPTVEFFRGGDAKGTTPFDRMSLAAETGRTAGWVIAPGADRSSPLQRERDALEPRLGLVHFGTNDMNLGTTPATALPGFYDAMTVLLDSLVTRGVIPVVFGITRRGDDLVAQRWVATYNAVLRGMAQARQIPFVDMFAAIDPLPGHGLSEDGVHLESDPLGACLLTEDALAFGYNMRNLIALEVLHRAVAVLVDDAEGLDPPQPPSAGEGHRRDPFVVDTLPFTRFDDSSRGRNTIDTYPTCDDADESGPEHWYRLSVDEATALRALVLDGPDIDVDVHLLDATGSPDGCLARSDRGIEGTLAPGDYFVVVDTYVSPDGNPAAGPYQLTVIPCDADDLDCAAPF